MVAYYDLCKKVKEYSWYIYNLDTESRENVTLEELLLNEGYSLSDIRKAIRVNQSWRCKCWRLKKKLFEMQFLADMCNYRFYFVTFTFNDDALERNSVESLKTAVRRYLKANSVKYVANVDYGAKNGRIHFHGCCIAEDVLPYGEWFPKYGALKVEKVRVEVDQSKQLAKYINKLALHAIKDTTGFNRIISWRRPKITYGA